MIPIKTSYIDRVIGKFFLTIVVCGFISFTPEIAFSQAISAPDAQTIELLRQQERERQLRLEQDQTPDVRLPRTAVPAAKESIPQNESQCFVISKISLSGDQAKRFQFALDAIFKDDDSPANRCLGSQGINIVLTRVQNQIVKAGFVTTRILVIPQDLKSGELQLQVIPGKISAIRFTTDSDPRGNAWNAIPVHVGDILNLRDIEQGLENFKRAPTADADIQIEPAVSADAKPGESDLVIRYRQAFPFRLSFSADDSGTEATGRYQGAMTISFDNPSTLNDLLYVTFNQDLGGGIDGERGTRGFNAHYSIPLGYWLASMNASQNNYHQEVAGINQTYVYSGVSRNSDIKISRLIYRDAVRKTTLSLRGYIKSASNYIDDTEIQIQRRRMAGWEAAATHREFIGNATLDANLAYRRGTGMHDSLPAPEELFDDGTARPEIITMDLSFMTPFKLADHQLRYNGSLRNQWNKTPLIPQDRFSIGGRYSVRGFDGDMVLAAGRGWLLRNDLGMALGASGQELYVGLDYGAVAGQAADLLIGTSLAGSVLGLRGNIKSLNYDLFVGTPLYKPEGFRTANATFGFSLNWAI